ncbi:hypothetical protein ACJX0J_036117, partial [Zea mays]
SFYSSLYSVFNVFLLYVLLQEEAKGGSLLQNQLHNIPISTWQLRTLLLSSPLNTCLDILLQ